MFSSDARRTNIKKSHFHHWQILNWCYGDAKRRLGWKSRILCVASEQNTLFAVFVWQTSKVYLSIHFIYPLPGLRNAVWTINTNKNHSHIVVNWFFFSPIDLCPFWRYFNHRFRGNGISCCCQILMQPFRVVQSKFI